MKRRVVHILAAAGLFTCLCQPMAAVSLYDPNVYRPLVIDNKAYRVGDALTVQVLEQSSASSTADTGTRRDNRVGVNVSTQVNQSSRSGEARASAGGEFAGGGQTQRTSRLLATLTVTVRDVLPNGDLLISGEQLLKVNDEQQRVHVEGRVRPQDVSDSNVVISNRIGDARITFVGEGDLSERTRRGALRRFLDWLGL